MASRDGTASAIDPDPTLIDPTSRHLRITAGVGVLIATVAGLLALARASGGQWMDDRTGADLSLLALICLAVAVAAAIVVFLAILASGRRTARIYARLRTGDVLADWRFEAAEWADWLAAERGHDPFTAVVFLICVAFALGATAWVAYPGWAYADASERVSTVLIAAGAIAAIGAFFSLGRWAGRRKVATMRDRPRVIVLDDAIYCGGVLHRWGAQMTVLRSIRFVPGDPPMLEATTGPCASLRAASTAMFVVGLLAGRSSGSVPDTTFRFPVPAGRLDEAESVMHRLR